MKKIQQTNLKKATIVIFFKDMIVSGKGVFEAKKVHDSAVFTATFVKSLKALKTKSK